MRLRMPSKSAAENASRKPWTTSASADVIGGQHPGDAVADEGRLLAALDLDREPGDRLPPAAADLLEGDQLGFDLDRAAHRHRRRKPNLVPPVVDAEREPGGG